MSNFYPDIIGETAMLARAVQQQQQMKSSMMGQPKGAPNPEQFVRGPGDGIFRRQPLPLGSRQVIPAAAQSVFIGRPQRIFRIERMTIQTSGSINDIFVTSLIVGADSQIIDTGDLPGSMFTAQSFDNLLRGLTADIGNQISVTIFNAGVAAATVAIGCVGEVIDRG